jgi:hypothetical protein
MKEAPRGARTLLVTDPRPDLTARNLRSRPVPRR